MRLIAAVAVLALVPTQAAAKCATMGLAPSVITPADAAIPLGGGIVVGARDSNSDRLDKGDIAVQADWRFVVDGVTTVPVIETLAPGLAVYRLPAKAVKATLEDGKHAALVKVTVGEDKPLALAAPDVKVIKRSSAGGRRPFTHIDVELAVAVPPGAVAIVLADAAGKPRSWHRVEAGKLTVSAFEISRCRVLPNGTVVSAAGDKVTVTWIDRGGRKSPASKPLAIQAVAAPAGADME